MTEERKFPVLHWRYKNCPKVVPWALVAEHEAQAKRNHGQSLEHLAERGGLDPRELWAVVHDVDWEKSLSIEECIAWLLLLAARPRQEEE